MSTQTKDSNRENKFEIKSLQNFSTNNLIIGDNIIGYDRYVVPNIIHFVRFGQHFDFVSLITLKSALINHNPDRIYIHCDCDSPQGKYWDMIKGEKKLVVRKIEMPRQIFGHNLSDGWLKWHASDVTRLKVLRELGGIYLDNDVYVLKSLNQFRIYEMSIGWEAEPEEYIGNQVLIAHKNARFLPIWYESYRDYDPNKWYYNAGQLPTQILKKSPQLVHRVKSAFGVSSKYVPLLYVADQWNSDVDLHTIHLLINHRYYLDPAFRAIPHFNEHNIKRYPKKFGELARLMFYGVKHFIN